MVGLDGIEPSTSRLSGVRSNRTELQAHYPAQKKEAILPLPWCRILREPSQKRVMSESDIDLSKLNSDNGRLVGLELP